MTTFTYQPSLFHNFDVPALNDINESTISEVK